MSENIKIERMKGRKGFTLLELMVAMTVTTLLVGSLMLIVRMSVESLSSVRDKTRVTRQAKDVLDSMARDFESIVVGSGSGSEVEWGFFRQDAEAANFGPNPSGGERLELANASELVFFTAATDRYDGAPSNDPRNAGGDISCVGYRLIYKDPITGDDGNQSDHAVFSLFRQRIDPDETFENLLAQENLEEAYDASYAQTSVDSQNFLAENIYELSITFLVDVVDSDTGTTSRERVSVVSQNSIDSWNTGAFESVSIRGSGLIARNRSGTVDDSLADGSIAGVELGITVLTDKGMGVIKARPIEQHEFLSKFSRQYSKTVILPRIN